MNKKRNKSDYTYEYAVAAYPEKFKGYVVSPTKICIQWEDVQLMTRSLGLAEDSLIKGVNCNRYMPVSTHGTDVTIIAVGSQMPVIEHLQMSLLQAYVDYHKEHREVYKKEYNKDFKDFIKKLRVELDRMFIKIIKEELK